MPGLFYTMEFKNVEETFVKVLIGDTRVAEADVPVIIQLDPAGSPLKLITVDNGESKFNPIKSQQAIITFLSNNETSLQTFSDGPDDRFPVTILYGTKIVFYGFLSLADNQEAFLPARNEVTLTANDKLAALKDVDLKDFDNFNPQGKYKIGNILGMCLQKTGKDLRINVINNLRHGTGQKTMLATFDSSPNQIITAITTFFYIGGVFTITGTAGNNITFKVSDVAQSIVTIIASNDAFTDEAEVMATFTDVTSLTHIYSQFIDAKTFEKAIGESENCYDVISKILGYDCFITQYNERWWICRVDEYDNNLFYVARFDENGEFEDIYTDNNLIKNIGFHQLHWLSDEVTNVLPTRPAGFAKLIYNFKYPLELVCNEDFSRGLTVISAPDLSSPNTTGTYEAECWTMRRISGSITSDHFIERLFDYGYEKERYLVITPKTGTATPYDFVQSQPVRVSEHDKLEFTVDWKFRTGFSLSSAATYFPALIWIEAANGDRYYWYNIDTPIDISTFKWMFRSAASGEGNFYIPSNVQADHDYAEWTTLSTSLSPVPITGKLYIGLIQLHQGNDSGDNQDGFFSNLELSIIPFINGSYQQYKGRHEKVTRDADGYLAKVEDDVSISDALRYEFKGALFFLNNIDAEYYLTTRWYDASKTALAYPTDLSTVKPYGKHQVFSVWNQYRLANTIYQFKFQGFGDDIPSLVHKFSVTDVSWSSLNRKFLMLTKEADLKLCEMTGTMEQVYHTTEGKIYTDPHEFKYI